MKPSDPMQEKKIEAAPAKRAYKSPSLRVYGEVKDLTESVSGYGAGDGLYAQDPPMTG